MNYLKKIKDYWFLILIGFFSLGYNYNDSYYVNFNIKITDYASMTELFFKMLPSTPYLSILITIIAIFIYTLKYANSSFSFFNLKDKFQKLSRENKVLALVIVLISIVNIILIVCTSYFTPQLHYSFIDFCQFIKTLLFYFIMLIGLNRMYPKLSNIINAIAIFIIIGEATISYGRSRAKSILINSYSKNITFKYESKIVKSSSNYCYLGETFTTIFLYNKMLNSTDIYKKEKVDSLSYHMP